MARKGLLANVSSFVSEETTETKPSQAVREYARRGASRSMMQSLDEMAETTMLALGGETIVDLDPTLLDNSFIADRIGEDAEDYQNLRQAISEGGQSTPILVRPHPDVSGRYMIVFGHRRARVARDLGIKVRAVIKPLADIAHVIMQGQENTARANLSFIEKALFALRLFQSGMSKDTIRAALTIDETLLSRMLSVAETIPGPVLEVLGAAKGIGRDRWEELKKVIASPALSERAVTYVLSPEFQSVPSQERFNVIVHHLKKSRRLVRIGQLPEKQVWSSKDNQVRVQLEEKGKTATLILQATEGRDFAVFINERLAVLYEEFSRARPLKTGE